MALFIGHYTSLNTSTKLVMESAMELADCLNNEYSLELHLLMSVFGLFFVRMGEMMLSKSRTQSGISHLYYRHSQEVQGVHPLSDRNFFSKPFYWEGAEFGEVHLGGDIKRELAVADRHE